MKVEEKWLFLIIILSFTLNVIGIDWGTPSVERNRLYFDNKAEIRESLSGVTPEKVKESNMEYKEELRGSRFNPVRSYHPDESQLIKGLSNMDPKKFDFNPHYLWYGTLYYYFLGLALGIAWMVRLLKLTFDLPFFFLHPAELAKFYIIGRLVSAIFTTLTVLLVYFISRKLYNKKTGLIASLSLALVPLSVINSHYLSVDTTEMFFITLTFLLSLRILNSDRNKWYILAGICAGLACNIKYSGVLIVSVIPLVHFLKGQRKWTDFLSCWINKKVLVSYLSGIATLLILNPFLITSYGEVVWCIKAYLGDEPQRNILSNIQAIFLGSLFYLRALYHGMGLPLLLLSLSGFIIALRKREKGEVLILFWIIFSFLFFAYFSKRSDRYILVIIPFLSILVPQGLFYIHRKHLRSLILIAVFLITFFCTLGYEKIFMEQDIRTVAGKWIAAHIPAGAKIGLKRDPYQFETPPINKNKYHLNIAGENLDTLDQQKPDYFVISEIEYYRRNRQRCDEQFSKGGYKLIKEFINPPRFLGIPFNDKNPSEDYLYIYPKIFIFKRDKGV